MNITAISSGSSAYKTINFGNKNNNLTSLTQNNNDSFCCSISEKTNKISKLKTGFIASVIAASTLLGIHQITGTSNVTTVPFEQGKSNLLLLSDIYNIEPDAVLTYNEIINNNNSKEIKVPSALNYLEEEKENLTEKLRKNRTIDTERIIYEYKIKALRDKIIDQKSIATTFKDNDYVYFKLHLNKNPYNKLDIQNSEKDGLTISSEDFKYLFDIKDGALKDNNENIIGIWHDSDNKELTTKQYLDFTNARLKDGEIYKVKLNDINTDEINLSKYYR